jgi:hypothetical protein
MAWQGGRIVNISGPPPPLPPGLVYNSELVCVVPRAGQRWPCELVPDFELRHYPDTIFGQCRRSVAILTSRERFLRVTYRDNISEDQSILCELNLFCRRGVTIVTICGDQFPSESELALELDESYCYLCYAKEGSNYFLPPPPLFRMWEKSILLFRGISDYFIHAHSSPPCILVVEDSPFLSLYSMTRLNIGEEKILSIAPDVLPISCRQTFYRVLYRTSRKC